MTADPDPEGEMTPIQAHAKKVLDEIQEHKEISEKADMLALGGEALLESLVNPEEDSNVLVGGYYLKDGQLTKDLPNGAYRVLCGGTAVAHLWGEVESIKREHARQMSAQQGRKDKLAEEITGLNVEIGEKDREVDNKSREVERLQEALNKVQWATETSTKAHKIAKAALKGGA